MAALAAGCAASIPVVCSMLTMRLGGCPAARALLCPLVSCHVAWQISLVGASISNLTPLLPLLAAFKALR